MTDGADLTSPVGAAEQLAAVVSTPHPYPVERFAGRGIVICAGGARLLTCAWVAINVLRRVVGCALPVELWHIGPGELGAFEAGLFAGLGVQIVDALNLVSRWPARTLGGWELKAYALVHSSFEQVLLLDADNVAVVDPAFLFDLPEFAATGAIAWPDLERLTKTNPIWELCGVPFRSEPAWETGQLLIDKARCWHALQIALHMNMHSELFYPHTHGDKDTFHLASIMAGAPWAMPGFPARLTATGLCQRDFEGRLIFQHRSGAKWRLHGQNVLSAEFRHQADCLRFISELRERWSGTIEALLPASAEDRAAERALCEIRWFTLEEAGEDSRLLELLAGNRIGVGAARDGLLRWYVRGGVLTMDGAVTTWPGLILENGHWSSRAETPDERRIRLLPLPEFRLDGLGSTALAVIEQFADRGTMAEADAVTTLATLGRVGDLTYALKQARVRWRDSRPALRVIELAEHRLGRGKKTDYFAAGPGYEPIA